MNTCQSFSENYTSCRMLSKAFEQCLQENTAHRMARGTAESLSKQHMLQPLSYAGTELWQEVLAWQQVHGGPLILSKRSLPLTPYPQEALRQECTNNWAINVQYPWTTLRAYSDYLVKHTILHSTVPGSLADCYTPESSYTNAFSFRKNPNTHFIAGFHTAISCFYKLYATSLFLWTAARHSREHKQLAKKAEDVLASPAIFLKESKQLLTLAKILASGHLFLLNASDSLLWDSAGAMAPYHFLLSTEGEFCLLTEEVEIVLKHYDKALTTVDVPEYRTGCPALQRPSDTSGVKLFEEVQQFCERLFMEYCYPLSKLPLPAVPFYETVPEGLLLIRDETHSHPAPLRDKI